MDLNNWLENRTFHHSQFSCLKDLVELKHAQNLSISLCFPTLNEAKTIGKEIKVIKKHLMDHYPLIDEIGIIDSGSTDATCEIAAKLGAKVFVADDCLSHMKPLKGKGENLWKSLYLFSGDIIVWVDGDIKNIHPKFVYGLIGPLLKDETISYVKAFYQRPIRIGRRLKPGGGRVTELLVRPFLSLLYPDLSLLAQPLSGEYAGRRELLERLPFFSNYGVEIGLLIDIEKQFGINAIAQVDMDQRIHRNQNIESLRRMSYAILSVLMTRLEQLGKLAILEGMGHQINLIKKEGSAYLHDAEEVFGIERPPMITVPDYQKHRNILQDDAALILNPSSSVPSQPTTITHWFDEALVKLNIRSRIKELAIKELVELAEKNKYIVNKDKVLTLLMEREKKMSTSIGHGIALPHLLTAEANESIIIIGRSIKGIDFSSSIIHRPVHLVFLIIAPETEQAYYLETLASLARLLKYKPLSHSLLSVKSPAEAVSTIKKYETVVRLHAELGIKALL